ncbi:MAG: SDR family oxidoreductase [Planctomycetes bacterium]|nr:SDR family oxidoreductase [Planctomycetota bacterium]MCB9905591.1 SDR family oxidoreductase [Planctomycetota bacterium]
MGTLHYDFTGDVAVVTGGARGIGAAIASALAAAGARVHVFDACEPEFVVPGVTAHLVDLRDADAVRAEVDAVLAESGGVQLLVNNAGVTRDAPLWKLAEEDWQAVLDVNLTGAFRVLAALAPAMREARHGRVVQIASINGMRGKFGQANYSASKAGLIGLTRTAALELGRRGITVNAVAPGLIDSAMTAELPSEIRARALEESALGKAGSVEDVAATVLFLLSEAARHITGVVVPVDGGQLA